jgi:RimJ/RimL family protein N-acetyltransferase
MIRLAVAGDAETILAWRNDPRIFANFRITEPVGRDEHMDWFAKSLASELCTILILEADDGPMGMIRLDEHDGPVYEISIIVDPGHQGRGYGSKLLSYVSENADGTLFALVKMENAASRRIFEKCGFKQVGHERDSITYRRDWT